MTDSKPADQRKTAKWGWGILLLVSLLMALNGVTWFFFGPARAPTYMAQVAGMPEEEFTQRFPELVTVLARPRRQVAIWYTAFGLLAFIVARDGFRHGTRWVWSATWLVVVVPFAIGLVYHTPGVLGDWAFLLPFGLLALIGQLLARPRAAAPNPKRSTP